MHCSEKLCVCSQNNIRFFSASECINYRVTTLLLWENGNVLLAKATFLREHNTFYRYTEYFAFSHKTVVLSRKSNAFLWETFLVEHNTSVRECKISQWNAILFQESAKCFVKEDKVFNFLEKPCISIAKYFHSAAKGSRWNTQNNFSFYVIFLLSPSQ